MRHLFSALLLCGLVGGCADRGGDAARARLKDDLRLELPASSAALVRGASVAYPGYAMQVLRYELTPGFPISALLFEPESPSDAAVVVAHGHYGQGKNAEESRDIAHGLAAMGYRVLVVDTPGVEEGDTPARQIHFEAGAHARAYLRAGGTSALALQVAVLRRGLDVLGSLGSRRFAATGASGGAVQALYLLLADARVAGAVLASFPEIPRAPGASGCLCDALPGWPGPSPALLRAIDRPTLWLSEQRRSRPQGLGRQADYEVIEGPHSYTAPMQDRALGWINALFGEDTPHSALTPAHQELHMPRLEGAITALPLHPTRDWTPAAAAPLVWSVRADGAGPAVLVAGGEATDEAAIRAVGLQPCVVSVEPPTLEEEGEALVLDQPLADRVVASLSAAASECHAVAAWGRRAWALPVSALKLPFVIADPLSAVAGLRAEDPTWIHVPGAWWGGLDRRYASALARGADPAALAAALGERISRGP